MEYNIVQIAKSGHTRNRSERALCPRTDDQPDKNAARCINGWSGEAALRQLGAR
jgi:hypothetical protein